MIFYDFLYSWRFEIEHLAPEFLILFYKGFVGFVNKFGDSIKSHSSYPFKSLLRYSLFLLMELALK